jgi:hypothetical protein
VGRIRRTEEDDRSSSSKCLAKGEGYES